MSPFYATILCLGMLLVTTLGAQKWQTESEGLLLNRYQLMASPTEAMQAICGKKKPLWLACTTQVFYYQQGVIIDACLSKMPPGRILPNRRYRLSFSCRINFVVASIKMKTIQFNIKT